MLWSENHGWTLEMFPLETPAEALGRFGPFKALWDSKRQDGRLPAWRNFQLTDFEPWYGWLIVEDVLPGETYNSRIRLWGTNVTRLWNVDLTGKLSRDFEGFAFSPEDFEMSLEMVRNPQFRICTGPLDWHHDFQWNPSTQVSMIQLPLANDGETVDRLIELEMMLAADECSSE